MKACGDEEKSCSRRDLARAWMTENPSCLGDETLSRDASRWKGVSSPKGLDVYDIGKERENGGGDRSHIVVEVIEQNIEVSCFYCNIEDR